jgi:hypothetical protein
MARAESSFARLSFPAEQCRLVVIRRARVAVALFGVGALLAMGSAAASRSTMTVSLLVECNVSDALDVL